MLNTKRVKLAYLVAAAFSAALALPYANAATTTVAATTTPTPAVAIKGTSTTTVVNGVTTTVVTPTVVSTGSRATLAGVVLPERITTVTPNIVKTPIVKTPPVVKSKFGNYKAFFSADSLWNSRPVDPTFGTYEVPKSSYFPSISAGAFSTGVFLAKSTDAAVTVTSKTGGGVADPDIGGYRTVTIPHFPADVIPASGGDGHADIVDEETGIIHSFWQLRKTGEKWTATLYSWSPLNGSGFGDPAHYYQGARAVGIGAGAGILRTHEIKDGNPIYNHALAMSMTFNALSKAPTYIFPATAADGNAATTNYGKIPEGALMMLPPSFDTSKIANADLKKVADTLKVYGAYVVDRNDGTPFAMYAEIGSGFNLMPKGWDNNVAAQLDRIRGGLRQVVSAKSWVNGEGRALDYEKLKQLNLLSMRGPWTASPGSTLIGGYDSWQQAIVFPATTKANSIQNGNSTGLSPVTWGKIAAGDTVKLTALATGGASLTMQVWQGGKVFATLGPLKHNESARVVWPTGAWIVLKATSGVGAGSTVKGDLVKVAAQ